MRTILISGGLQTFVSMEEFKFLEKFNEQANVYKEKLTERDAEIARILTSRGVLDRKKDDIGIYYIRETNSKGDE